MMTVLFTSIQNFRSQFTSEVLPTVHESGLRDNCYGHISDSLARFEHIFRAKDAEWT